MDCLSATSAVVSSDDDDVVTCIGAPPLSQLHIPASHSRAAKDAVANMIDPKSMAIANVEMLASRVGEYISPSENASSSAMTCSGGGVHSFRYLYALSNELKYCSMTVVTMVP